VIVHFREMIAAAGTRVILTEGRAGEERLWRAEQSVNAAIVGAGSGLIEG
jgi:hypothetical protein